MVTLLAGPALSIPNVLVLQTARLASEAALATPVCRHRPPMAQAARNILYEVGHIGRAQGWLGLGVSRFSSDPEDQND